MVITIPKRQCLRCGHRWMLKKEKEPTVCPKCMSPYWNIPRKEKGDVNGR